MTNKPNSRGSEWRKWDLHVHTPASNNFIGSWEQFYTSLKNANCDVIGINDYFSVAGYKQIAQAIQNNQCNIQDKVLLPIVEMRMIEALTHKNSDKLLKFNFHIIFSNTIDVNDIEFFLRSLKHNGTTIGTNYDDSAKLKEIKVNFYDTITSLNEDSKFRDNFLIWLPYDEYGGIDNINPIEDGWIKDGYIKKSHILGSANQKQIDFFLWKSEKFTEQQFIEWFEHKKPCIKGSDSHNHQYPIGKLQDKNSQPIEKFCWIKADPTFEGLKQIVYEPEDRVRIQASNPLFDNEKPYFDSIVLCEDVKVYDDSKSTLHIKKATFNLNPNLVAIIGGRGTGKSTLINYLRHSFDKTKEREIKMLSNQCFSTKYCKVINPSEEDIDTFTALNSNSLDFVFIQQGGFKEQVRKGELSSELKRVANLESIAFSDILTSEINKINREIQDCTDYRGKKNESSEEINTQVYCDKIIKTNQTLLSNITNSKNKEDIEHYNKNLKEISKLQNLIKKAEIIEEKIKDFVSDIESTISQLDEDGKKSFSIPVLTEYNKSVKITKEDCKNQIHTFEAINQAIEDSLKEKGISGDFTTLLNNVSKYQKIISDGEIKKKEIQVIEEKFKKLKDSRSLLGNRIVEDCKRQENEINDGWSGFLSKHSDERKKIIEDILLKNNGKGNKIEVYGKIIFDSGIFWKLLKEANHGSILEEKLKEEFGSIQDANSWATYIAEKFNDKIDSLKIKKNEFLNLFFDKNTRQQYLRTEAKMRYDGKELSKLSDGQKGTAYLRLQLANSAFSEPIIFDQPEDDLDNEFIVEELVDIFKRLKKYRQIIIVTHNANLVVNADAEQVIVAQNDDEYLSYRCGSLEDADIQNAVCRILEGGKHAFEKRRKKYNFDKLKNAN